MTAAIISGAIVLVIIIAVVILNELTKPVDESKAGAVAIGGMLSGRDINYKTPESKGIEKNPIIKIMQLS